MLVGLYLMGAALMAFLHHEYSNCRGKADNRYQIRKCLEKVFEFV